MSDKTDTIVFLYEGAIKSIVTDSVTFAWLIVLPWFNYNYGGGSGWIYAAIGLAWSFAIFARAGGLHDKHRKTPAELRAWLDANHPVKP